MAESRIEQRPIARVVERLARDFGDRLTTAQAVREQHGRGESHHRTQSPDAVVFPTSTEEVAAIVRLCAEHGVPVIPFGAGTSLEGNVSAMRGGVTVDLSRMTRIVRVSAEDLDCTVEAGVTRQQLNSHLRDMGLFFPIDPGGEATIGGMAATRASGTNAVRYGTMREAVLSLTVVTADGRIIRTARRARKSSAGYDLTRLFVGSEGTLGVITEVTMRLHGIPEATDVAVATFADLKQAIDTTVALIQSGVPVARVELLDDEQMKAINAYAKADHPLRSTLFFEFHGTPQSVAEQRETARAFAQDFGAESFRTADTREERAALWRARHQAFYATVALRPGGRGWASDVCVPLASRRLHLRSQGASAEVVRARDHRRACRRRQFPCRLQRVARRSGRHAGSRPHQRGNDQAGDRLRRNLHRRAWCRHGQAALHGSRAWRGARPDARRQGGARSPRHFQSGQGDPAGEVAAERPLTVPRVRQCDQAAASSSPAA